MIENMVQNFIEKKLAGEATPEHCGARSLAKGLLAGVIAGVAATAAKSLVEKVYPPRTHGEPEPPAVLAEEIVGHPLDGATRTLAVEGIHWGFGAAAGAAYGALAEYYPAATGKQGANFGMTLMALTHESALPALGLAADPAAQTTREKSSEMASHIVFGLVAETVRRLVRQAL